MLNGHLENLSLFLARPVELYYSLFATTRNGLFQSLIFLSFGMLIARINQADELKPSVKNGLFVGAVFLKNIGFANVLALV